MKKLLLFLSVTLAIGTANAQNLFNFGFGGVDADFETTGFIRTNQSILPTAALWRISTIAPSAVTATSTGTPFQNQVYAVGQTPPVPNGQDGAPNAFAIVNYQSTTSPGTTGGTISNWLITPAITVQNGDVVSFYTRVGTFTATGSTPFPDRLEFRMSTNGDFAAVPATGPADLGDFTTLLLSVNPDLSTDPGTYPQTWTQYTSTMSGLTGETSVKFAFRYYVTDGGPAGNNSNLIGLDTFSVDRTLGTQQFFNQNFAVYPNPANDVLNINSKNGVIKAVSVTDIDGRTVKTINVNEVSAQISIADLNAGVYFVKVSSDAGTGTTKIVKN